MDEEKYKEVVKGMIDAKFTFMQSMAILNLCAHVYREMKKLDDKDA